MNNTTTATNTNINNDTNINRTNITADYDCSLLLDDDQADTTATPMQDIQFDVQTDAEVQSLVNNSQRAASTTSSTTQPQPSKPPADPPPADPPPADPPPAADQLTPPAQEQPEPKLVFVYHFDFLKENTPKRGSVPSRTFVNRLQQQMRASSRLGLHPAVFSAQMSEHYTSKMNAYLRYSQAAADDYNCKYVTIAADERPLPYLAANGEWCVYEDPRAHRRIRQRDELAALVQAYALVLFMNGQPRPDELSFPWQVEERKQFQQAIAENASPAEALRAHIRAWRSARSGKLRARSAPALAAALFGVCNLTQND